MSVCDINKTKDYRDIFDNIFDTFTKKINSEGRANTTGILFDLLKDEVWDIHKDQKSLLPIKFLNIFNKDKISFYAECISSEKKVTTDRSEANVGDKKVFGEGTITIGTAFQENNIFDEIYQYSYKNSIIIEELIDYYSKKDNTSDGDTNIHSPELKKSLDKKPLTDRFNNWLNALDGAYVESPKDNPATHYFYTIGPVSTGSDLNKEKYEKFIVRANVGFEFNDFESIDGKKLLLKKFLKALRSFTSKLTNYLIKKEDESHAYYQSTRAAISQVFVRNIAHNIVSHVLMHLTNEKAFSAAGIYQLINKPKAYQSDILLPEINILEKEVRASEINEGIDGMIRLLDWFQDNDKADKVGTLKTTLRSLLNKECIENIDVSKKKLQESKIKDEDEVVESSRVKLKKVIEEAGESFINAFEQVSSLFNDEIYNKEKILYPNQQVANLFAYVANRCLYLNEATYGVSNMVGIKRVYGELFKELDANRILLNHISAIDNFRYKINFQHNGKELDEKNDISVSLPADVLGAQAFYNIIENIIRNTAKHNNSKTDGVVEFTVNFIDEPLDKEDPFSEEDKYYRVEIWDDVPITSDKAKLDEEIENIKKEDKYYKYFSVTNDKDVSKTTKDTTDISISCVNGTEDKKEPEIKDAADLLVFKQNTRMNNPIITDKHVLRTNSLGLIEMEASAAFLRQIDLPEIENDYYTLKHGEYYNTIEGEPYPYFIQAFKKDLGKDKPDNERYSLGYRFYMKKPEKFLIISEKEFAEDKKKQLLNKGIAIISREKFKKSLEGDTPTCYNHEFVLLVGKNKNEDTKSPFKFFFENREDKKEAKNKAKEKAEKESKDGTQVEGRTPELSLLPERLMRVDNEFIKDLGQEGFEVKIWRQWENTLFRFSNSASEFPISNLSENYLVLFDHLTKNDLKVWKNTVDFYKNTERKGKVYFEALSSNAQNKLPSFNSFKNLDEYRKTISSSLRQNLWEAYDNGVVIVDERVQAFSFEKYMNFNNIFQSDMFKYSNVTIPDSSISLANKKYSTTLKNNIKCFIETNIDRIENIFLVVHFGVLERLFDDNEKIEKKLEEWSKKIRVVVTTGRGKHSLARLPKNVSYINLSTLLYAVKENRNKYSINYILNQSRR